MEKFSPRDYWEQRLTGQFDLGSVGHLSLGTAFNKWAYRIRGIVFRRLVKSLPVDPRTCAILDIGSGTGFYLDRWKSLGAVNITGSDFTEKSVAELRAKYPDCGILNMDIGGTIDESLAGGFDIISAMDVLFHIVDDAS